MSEEITNSGLTAAYGVEQTRDNAEALQLTWGVRFATVVNIADSATNVAMVSFDDSSESVVPALILIGGIVAGHRVAILTVPPGGNYLFARPP